MTTSPRLVQDLDQWLDELAPHVIVSSTEGRLDLGPGQFVEFVEAYGPRASWSKSWVNNRRHPLWQRRGRC